MNVHGLINEPQAQRYTANLAPEDVSSNDGQTYPVVMGTQRVPLMWIGQIWDQRTKAVKQKRGGKKGK